MNPDIELTVAAAEQTEQVFDALERLAVNHAMELTIAGSENVPAFLTALRQRRPDSLDWWPLEDAEDAVRVLVVRREPRPRSIAEFLGGDHHRLTGYWQEFLGAVQACARSYETVFTTESGHRTVAVRRLSEFIFGLRRHIRMEEELFFPILEEKAGIPAGAGPTAVMRAEHRQIRQLLDAMEKDLLGGFCATLIQAIENQPAQLSSLLRSHDMKEENVLYPLADRVLTEADRDALCLRMQAI